MSPRRSRRDIARSLRAPDGEPLADAAFTQRLAAIAGSETAAPGRSRLRLAVIAIVAPIALVVASFGVAYGSGAVTPPWRSRPSAPASPTPTSPSPGASSTSPGAERSGDDDRRTPTPSSTPTATVSPTSGASPTPRTSPTPTATTSRSGGPVRPTKSARPTDAPRPTGSPTSGATRTAGPG